MIRPTRIMSWRSCSPGSKRRRRMSGSGRRPISPAERPSAPLSSPRRCDRRPRRIAGAASAGSVRRRSATSIALDCPSPQEEAGAIALLLRQRLETPGATAALVTPDRDLARRVATELRRWDIEIDNSAGLPLNRTPPGIFLRLVLDLADTALAPVPLLAALKHPLAVVRQGAGGVARAGAAARDGGAARTAAGAGSRRPCRGAGSRIDPSRASRSCASSSTISRRRSPRCSKPSPPRRSRSARSSPPISPPPRRSPRRRRRAAPSVCGATRPARRRALRRRADRGGRRLPAAARRRLSRPVRGAARRAGGAAELRQPSAARDLGPARGAAAARRSHRARRPQRGHLAAARRRAIPGSPGRCGANSACRRRSGSIGPAAHDFAQALGAREVVLTRALRVEGTPTVPSRWLLRLETVLRAAELDPLLQAPDDVLAWQALLDRPDAAHRLAAARAAAAARGAAAPALGHRDRDLDARSLRASMRGTS